MKKQLILIIVVLIIGYIKPVFSAKAVQAPQMIGLIVSDDTPVADATIILQAREPEFCNNLTIKTDNKGKFTIGPLCEYRTKIPSIRLEPPVMYGYNLFIYVDDNVYLWHVMEQGYSPFKLNMTIDLSKKTLCTVKDKKCFDLFWLKKSSFIQSKTE